MNPPYPAVYYSTSVVYNGFYATGTDDSSFASTIVAPNVSTSTGPSMTNVGNNTVTTWTASNQPATPLQMNFGGRKDFSENIQIPEDLAHDTPAINATPVTPTFPYLPDNFYYTAASVAPPNFPTGSSHYPPYYQNLTTEIGGWTGNGWHKMMEFFEVPSSANGRSARPTAASTLTGPARTSSPACSTST